MRRAGRWLIPPMMTLCLLTVTAVKAHSQFTDILFGHYETHVDYDNDAGQFEFYVSYNPTGDYSNGASDVRMNAANYRFVAPPACQTTFTNAFAEIATPGTKGWIMPQISVVGAPYLGVRAIFSDGLFYDYFMGNYFASGVGSIRYRVESVTGTGPAAGGYFGMYVDSFGEPYFLVNTKPGSGAPNEVQTLTPNAHEHFAWVFTKPGSYDLTIRATGKLLSNNTMKTGTGVYHFNVPFSSRLSGSSTLARLGYGSTTADWHILLEDPTNNVAYRSNQGFLEVPSPSRRMPLAFSALGSTVANIVGQTLAKASNGIPAGVLQGNSVSVRLVSVEGPGHFSLLDSGGTIVLMNSADGISAADSINVSRAANLATQLSFTANGLYRLSFALAGTSAGGQAVSSTTISLVCGVGLTADHTYAQWADSFERTAGLTTGALTNPQADQDADGFKNGHEFQLFWHGFNPTRADGNLCPVPGIKDGYLALDFLRDTFKDRLDGTGMQLNAALSSNLTSWTIRTVAEPGYPLDAYETGAELGNALGKIMWRRLRIPHPTITTRGFGRFNLLTP